jgi:DNA-binding transcriptional LysR family regulator
MRGTKFAELMAFVAVAEHRNFTKAAAHLDISPPSLSHAIRSFEERVGVRLFNRTTRSVALTGAGERLLADAQPVLDAIDKAIDGMNEFRDKPVGVLRLSVARPIASTLVGPLIPKFLTRFPEIELEMVADDSHHDIVSGHFDAGIHIGERIAKDMIAVRLLDEFRNLAVASPTYLSRFPRPMEPDDLTAHNCVRLRLDWDGSVLPWTFENAGRRLETSVDGSLVLNDFNLLLSAVLDGIGIGYLPEIMIAPLICSGQLIPLLGDWCGRRSGVFLYYPSRRQLPVPLRAFIDFMRAESSAVITMLAASRMEEVKSAAVR